MAVVETPEEPAGYTLIGGPVGMSEVEGRDALREAQALLAEAGYDPGPADGLMGPRTRAALNEFQDAVGIPPSGTLTVDTQGALQAARAAASRNAAEDTAARAAQSVTPPAQVASLATSSSRPSVPPASGSNTWVAFLSGQDIRAECNTQMPDTYRFVYNAEYTEHVRLYEMYDAGDGSAILNIIVRGPTHFAGDPRQLSGRVTGKRSVNGLAPFERNTLIETLVSSGFLSSPVPEGTVLPSDGHFWVVSACRNGQFTLNAWTYPSDRWESISFPNMLGQLDFTNVMFNPLSTRTDAQRAAARDDDGPAQAFDIRVSGGRLALN